jgi:hypothetical protein
MNCFDIWFGRYGFLELGFSAGQTGYTGAWPGFWATRCAKLAVVRIQNLEVTISAFQRLLKHTIPITAATVTAV